jgi:hypothetical protein
MVRQELACRAWRPADLERLLGTLRAETDRLEQG